MYSDAGGASCAVSGENSVRHEAGRWLFEAVLRLAGDPARVQHNRYEIEPFSPGGRSTHWSSSSPAIGALRGRYRGFECLQQREQARYAVRGTLLEEDKVLSTWALELTRL